MGRKVDSSPIREALAALQGLPLWAAGRAGTMLWLQLGARVPAPTKRDPKRIAGEFALHLQCPWRITGSDGVVTGSGDMFTCDDPDSAASFDPGRPGNAVADDRLRDWIASHAGSPLVVVAADTDEFGGLHLRLSDGFGIEAFPDSTGRTEDPDEHWRLLRPGKDLPHLAVRGRRASRE